MLRFIIYSLIILFFIFYIKVTTSHISIKNLTAHKIENVKIKLERGNQSKIFKLIEPNQEFSKYFWTNDNILLLEFDFGGEVHKLDCGYIYEGSHKYKIMFIQEKFECKK